MTLFRADEQGLPEGQQKPPKSKAQRKRTFGVTLLVGSLVIAVGLAAVPSAYVIEQPGPWFDTLGVVSVPDPEDDSKKDKIPLITIEGVESYPTTGELDLLTVSVLGNPEQTPSWLEVAGAWFDPAKAVVPMELIFPKEETTQEREASNTAQMVDSQQDAIAAALTSLGYDVVVGVEVLGFTKESPATSVLAVGDVITAFNGTAVESVPQLRELLATNGSTQPGTVSYIRGGVAQEAQVTPMDVDGNVVLGIGAKAKYDFPFDVSIRLDDVGGPSAGMMFALGIIDKLTPEDITDGNHFAGTGTIDAQGNVGPIGGIQQKLYGAKKAGATYFLAPADNCNEVVGHVPSGLQVYSVKTLDDALSVLSFVKMHGEKSEAMNAKMGMLATCQN
ncbi:PDZ domain-containing protein [Aurantimicrobium minutum]|uniref:YlbL family protein n=1 Tax=Aurantimicrobium minutum TaxID=708131 RepID=UPI002475E5C9|nr:S16 family serine protease [Aurantimicrobium minutum]MDH6278111.1 PDZ domain-containing protein [Aurantimicrobium minutum]